ncbi:MAG TPA: serine/threonine-protein kinase [Luteolibacter sp.]
MSDEFELAVEEAIFAVVLELSDPAHREAFLDKVCAGDPALRGRIQGLLDTRTCAEKFFDFIPAPLRSAPASVGAEHASDPNQPHIGPYRIVRRLGEGGYGVVYLAEQETPVRRSVALKIVRPGMDTERIISRFLHERQALAMMDHPGIARIYDAGATDSGRPYFAMELVTGERITTYCEIHRLTIEQRLELFIQVCLAVQHAHQKGILHRDLKPSNVLVTGQDDSAAPKVIDFGIAKTMDPYGESSADVTQAAEPFIGTPAYMSPEQAAEGHREVDTRADIYGLGAMLYELLTGRPPFDSKLLMKQGPDVMRRTLRDVDPPAPSALLRSLPAEELTALAERRQCTPGALNATLRHDLDWVVMRALEKEPGRRYATVQGLASDLRRYLDHEPVAARPPGGLYRLGKLTRRNRAAVFSGLAVFVALLAGFGVSTRLYLRERVALREKTRLLEQAEQAERISQAVFLTRDDRMEEANALLAEVRLPDRPTFEALTAYRTIGEWLALQERWSEAADRFAVVERVGELDAWRSATLDHQAYGVALLMSGNVKGYETFRRKHAVRFANETNGDAVGRVLKTCLLRPIDPAQRERLEPLGQRVEVWFPGLQSNYARSWAVVPIALWRYRTGEIEGAVKVLQPAYRLDDHSLLMTTVRVLLALCARQQGNHAEADSLMAAARADIPSRLTGATFHGGNWYDWAFIHLLLEEAEALPAAK